MLLVVVLVAQAGGHLPEVVVVLVGCLAGCPLWLLACIRSRLEQAEWPRRQVNRGTTAATRRLSAKRLSGAAAVVRELTAKKMDYPEVAVAAVLVCGMSLLVERAQPGKGTRVVMARQELVRVTVRQAVVVVRER